MFLMFACEAVAIEEPVATQQQGTQPNGALSPYVDPAKQSKHLDLKSPTTRDTLIEQAFGHQMDMMLPMETKHIAEQKQKVRETEKAIRQAEPLIATGSKQLILEPNAPIPVVLLTPGYVTALVFYDVTGAPWPITSCTEGNVNHFSVVKPEDLKPGNMITVQSTSSQANSNIILTLAEFSLPVVIQIKTIDFEETGKVTDSMVSFRATKKGPLAKEPKIGRITQSPVSDQLMSFLDGIPPKKAERIDSVSNYNGMDMWRYKGVLYFRTVFPVIWPAWDLIVNGSEGIKLYRLPDVSNILVSDGGKSLSIDVK